MNPELLRPEIQQFIIDKTDSDVTKLALSKNPFPNIEWREIVNQIAARQKAKFKLPSWYNCRNIIYPSKISVEQTSSERTAAYKLTLLNGESLIDLTGGFGVDAYYFSKKMRRVIHVETNSELSAIAQHNAGQLQVDNIEFLSGDGTEILKKSGMFDWIYVDPSRRTDAKGKVFMLKDCLPNVTELQSLYVMHAKNTLIKTAPILDISAGLLELQNVKEIQVVAVDNEVKELLWIAGEKTFDQPIAITAVNLSNSQSSVFSGTFGLPRTVGYSIPKQFLYEPNAAIMKAALYDDVAAEYAIDKLHPNSHLYTSDEMIAAFPGRIFKIDNVIPYNKTQMAKFLQGSKANVTTRNFPDKVEVIRKKYKISDGGTTYSFFTTDLNDNKIALICTKLN